VGSVSAKPFPSDGMVSHGVPPGSALGALLFSVLRVHSAGGVYFYADDIQLYLNDYFLIIDDDL